MAEGSPVRALERGERVELPPVLYIQDTRDIVHPRADLERFVAQYRQAGGQVELELFEGAMEGFMPRDPSSHPAARVLGRISPPGDRPLVLPPREQPRVQPRDDQPRREEPRRVEPRSEPRRDEPRRDEPRRVEPRNEPRNEPRSEPRRAEPRNEPRSQPEPRAEPRRDPPRESPKPRDEPEVRRRKP